MSDQSSPVPVVVANKPSLSSSLAVWLTIIIALVAIVTVILPMFGVDLLNVTGPAPAPTVRTLPTTAPAAPVQAAPTSPPAAPTPLPQGQPVAPVQADPAAPLPAMAAPVTGPNPAAPATIKTRAPVCFGGWWYVEGQNTEISCSGTGGD
jgi:hypothetical protein